MRQTLREVLAQSHEWLHGTQSWIDQLPIPMELPALEALRPTLQAALRELAETHARVDLDLLLEAHPSWQHPSQALRRPRASYALLAEVAAGRLAEARDEAERQRLEHVHERLALASEIETSAQARRLALAYTRGPEPTDSEAPARRKKRR